MESEKDSLICVGHILGAQGVKGWVKVFSNTSPRENIVGYSPWLIEQDDGLKTVNIKGRLQGKNVLAKLDGVEDRTQAEALTGFQLYITPGQLAQLEVGEYYWSELIGLKVETLASEPLGTVEAMLETGADDVMVLKGERERLIPFVLDKIVTEVDLKKRRIVVDWSSEY